MAEASNAAPDNPVYPAALFEQEMALLQTRRAVAQSEPRSQAPATLSDTVGVALSGGGIRSAVFCLGLFQSFAKSGFLRRIDYLSTVSGGSYFGAFLGALFARGHGHSSVAALLDPAGGHGYIDPVSWLRQNGRYLAPGGGTDTFRIFAILLRNWLALQLIIGSVLLSAGLVLRLTSDGLKQLLPASALNLSAAISPLAWLILLPLLPALAGGIGYWFSYWTPNPRRTRQHLTTLLTKSLLAAIAISALALIDTLALHVERETIASTAAGAGASLLTLLVAPARRLLMQPIVSKGLQTLWKQRRLPLALMLWPVALAIWGLYVVGALAIIRTVPESSLPALIASLVALQLALAFGARLLNRTSLHAFYSERLTRTFVGASNPRRYPGHAGFKADNAYISEAISGDDLNFADYQQQVAAHGGPLHFINTTLNETASQFASTILRDRKGLTFTIGPCGASAGVVHHAINSLESGARAGEPGSAASHRPRWPLQPVLPLVPQTRFQVFGATPFLAEAQTLGAWTAISGAAVATGLGAYGGTALSLLTGFTNLRLGYWWRANTVGQQLLAGQPTPKPLSAGRRPMQQYLIDELLGRFFGPHRHRWYLSDGGHSENTGALELIRRRVATIVVVDTESEPYAPTGTLGVLVQKARQDYHAEISFDLPPPAAVPTPGDATAPPQVPNLRMSTGRIRYLAAAPGLPSESRLIYIRPALRPDDPADLLRYHIDNPSFPYQSTADQFFDEAQWESYRKLGELTGAEISI